MLATFYAWWYLTNYVTWLHAFLIVQAPYGLLLFELGWRDTYRFR